MENNWYKAWFNTGLYLNLYRHRDETDAKKLVSLLFKHIDLPAGSSCLDLACGNGRHSILFAKRGYKVTGFDLSPYLINQAKKKLKAEYKPYSNNLRFVIGNMKQIGYKNEFSLAVNLFTSFGYFEKDSDNFRVIEGISKSLKSGGYFLIDFLNKDYLKKNLVPFDLKRIGISAYIQIRHIEDSFVIKNIFIIQNYLKHKSTKIHHYLEKIRLYSINDFRKIFHKYKLNIINIFGDYYGSKFNSRNSERLIILAKKK